MTFCIHALVPLDAAAAGPKRVLILDPFGRDVAPFSAVISTFRATLVKEIGEPVDIYEIPLDLARFSGPEGEAPLVAFLEGRLKIRPVDLVVSVGGAGAGFVARHRERLFPHTPLLFTGADPRLISPDLLQRDAAMVVQKTILKGMVEDIMQLQPQTTNIVVVFGASPLEKFWVKESRREFQAYADRIKFTWVDDLSEAQVLERCATLPPHSFILHGLFLIDALGKPNEKNQMMRRLHEVANAPIFGIFESEFGLGSVGGHLYRDREVGRLGAQMATRILHGEPPAGIPPMVFETGTPVYDWRELHRWGISEARLPAGSIIQFRVPGYWERNWELIVGSGSIVLLLVALIVALLIHRARLRQAEAEATLIADISAKFVNLIPHEVDREINAALRRICEFLDIDVAVLWQPSSETPGAFGVTHIYQQPNAPVFPLTLSQQDFPWTAMELLAGRTTIAASLRDLPAAAATDCVSARRAGIKSHVTLPLLAGGAMPIGLLGFNATRRERTWPAVLVKRLELIGQIFASALARKQADQALRESEERMTMAAEAAGFGIWAWSIDRNQVWGSNRWLDFFGFAPGEDVSFEQVIQRIHPDDRETVEREVRHALEHQSQYAGDFRTVLPDGTQRWISARGRVYSGPNGRPARMLGTASDITVRREEQDRMRQLSHAMEQSSVLVTITDLQGRMTYVNRKFTEVTGYAEAECLGQNPRILKSGEYPSSTYEELWRCLTHGQTWRGEFHNRKKNGELYWEWAVISPLRDAAGKTTHYIAVKDDITARKEAEAELRLKRAELAHVARVSTLGELAASVAHELNQPLGAIHANAEAAELFIQQNPPAYTELKAILADIRHDDERAGEVIRRMRNLLRKHELERRPIEVNALVEDVLQFISGEAALRGVVLSADLGPALPLIAGDRVHLQQVLLNLLLNGMDAMNGQNRERRQLSVRTHLCADGQVELAVADMGHGIPSEQMPRLFEAFYTTKPTGMGMGLSIARTIIEAHHGRIWAENQAAGGAVFRIALPVLPEARAVDGER